MEIDTRSDARSSRAEKEDTLFRPAPRKPASHREQPGVQPASVTVRIGTIEALERSQYLLSHVITLAYEVGATLQFARDLSGTEWRAANRHGSGDEPAPWERLRDAIEAIASLQPSLRPDARFGDPLHGHLDDFHGARRSAKDLVRELVDSVAGPDGGVPTPSEKVQMRGAIYRLIDVLDECAAACRRESDTQLDRIGVPLQGLLGQLKEPRETSAKPADTKTAATDGAAAPIDAGGDRKPDDGPAMVGFDPTNRKG